METPKYFCPGFRSSDQIFSAPARSAAENGVAAVLLDNADETFRAYADTTYSIGSAAVLLNFRM